MFLIASPMVRVLILTELKSHFVLSSFFLAPIVIVYARVFSAQQHKNRYLSDLKRLRSDKRVLNERFNQMKLIAERNQETSRREERALLSSIHEIGVRLLDRNIQVRSHVAFGRTFPLDGVSFLSSEPCSLPFFLFFSFFSV